MLCVTMFYSVLIFSICLNAEIKANIIDNSIQDEKLLICVDEILQRYFKYARIITYLDMNYKNGEIAKIINANYRFSITSGTADTDIFVRSDGYIITAGNAIDFILAFPSLVEDVSWRPDRKIVIIIENLMVRQLHKIFDLLLKHHVFNVLIINNSNDHDLYTYNIFENNGCGKRYNRIINKGKCLDNSADLFINDKEINLKNCTFEVSAAHWPPYSIDPKIKRNLGLEEYVVRLLSDKEQFNIDIPEYRDDAQDFTPVEFLLKRKSHIIYGGMFLTSERAKYFDYIWEHVPYVDDLRIVVKRAQVVPPYKNLYKEFHTIVWIVLFLTCVLYTIFVTIVLRPTDKIRLVYIMFDYFFQHGKKCECLKNRKMILGIWIWFTYLINIYYQSSLMGLTSNPVVEYQIKSEADITDYNIKPCISTVTRNFYLRESKYMYTKNHLGKECDELIQSIRTVTGSFEVYSITMYYIYMYNKYKFYDEFGATNIYSLPPLNKVLYAIYLYKGFPLMSRLKANTLKLRESGIIQRYFDLLFDQQLRSRHFKSKTRKYCLYIPWLLLVAGNVISGIAFIIEIAVYWYKSRLQQ